MVLQLALSGDSRNESIFILFVEKYGKKYCLLSEHSKAALRSVDWSEIKEM